MASSKPNHVLDVTNIKNDATGSSIIPESKLTEDYIRSSDYYIVSLDRDNYDKVINKLSTGSSRVKTPVPRRNNNLDKEPVTTLKLQKCENINYLKDSLDLSDSSFIEASKNGCLENVKFLASLESIKPDALNNSAFIAASMNGHLDVVKFLASLDSITPGAGGSNAVIYASMNGHLDVVKFLASLPSINLAAKSNHSIVLASKNGHLKVVKFLSSFSSVDPEDQDHLAIKLAKASDHTDVVKFLESI
jgi:ankyrin repeat protein